MCSGNVEPQPGHSGKIPLLILRRVLPVRSCCFKAIDSDRCHCHVDLDSLTSNHGIAKIYVYFINVRPRESFRTRQGAFRWLTILSRTKNFPPDTCTWLAGFSEWLFSLSTVSYRYKSLSMFVQSHSEMTIFVQRHRLS